MEERKRHTPMGFAFGLLVGTLVGAATAILLAPRPGAETRERVGEKVRDLQERISSLASDVRQGFEDLKGRFQKEADTGEDRKSEGSLSSDGVTVI